MPTVFAEIDDEEEFERMRKLKNWHGLTWEDVLNRGIDDLPDPTEAPEL